METAEAALKSVLSDVGANMPVLTQHDKRIIDETLNKTFSCTGSKTGKMGLIDREADAGGYEDIGEARHPEGYDTDRDGMPDWWERLAGFDPTTPDNNSDPDNDGYTALEEFLNWMAEPHYTLEGGKSHEIDLSPLFAGYGEAANFSVSSESQDVAASTEGNILKVSLPKRNALAAVRVTAEEAGASFTRNINICINGDATGIENVNGDDTQYAALQPAYNIGGQKLDKKHKRQIVVRKGKKTVE